MVYQSFDGLSKLTSQWKNKNSHNFWSRRDLDFIFFEGVLTEKLKLHAFFGFQ